MISDRWKHTGKDLQAQVLFVAQAVGASLDDPDLVVETFDKAESDLVLGLTEGRDASPVAIDHVGELLVGLQALPLQSVSPVLEEAPRPTLALVVPELPERFFQHIGGVQSPVGLEQEFQGLAALEGEVVPARQQGVLLAFDETAILVRQPRILALAHR